MNSTNWNGRHELLVDGEFVESADTFSIIDPASEEIVGEAPQASPADVDAAVRSAARAFETWSRTQPHERAAVLDRAADILEADAAAIADLAQRESGCVVPLALSMHAASPVERLRRYARGAMEPRTLPLAPQVPPRSSPTAVTGMVGSVVLRQPVGVVACITPYNAPLSNTAGKIGPALAMGNTVVVKPAAQNPLAVLKLARALVEAGAPRGVVNVLTDSGSSIAERLVQAPEVDMISFTGSTRVGQKIAQAASPSMKRLLLELGGKGAALVFEDADLPTAARDIASSWNFFTGQICTAPTRVLVHQSVHDQLVDLLTSAAAAVVIGDPRHHETVAGPVISAAHRHHVDGFVSRAIADGATALVGGSPMQTDRGFFVNPTLFVDVRSDMEIVREEVFGPVVSVLPFTTEDEAIELANSTSYGLYDYVYSANTSRAYEVGQRLRSGGIGINTIRRHAEAPFGGFKMSGVGRDGGSFGLHAYSEMQSIVYPV